MTPPLCGWSARSPRGQEVLRQGPPAPLRRAGRLPTAAPLRFGAVRPWSHSGPCATPPPFAVYDAEAGCSSWYPIPSAFAGSSCRGGLMLLNGERLILNRGEPARVEPLPGPHRPQRHGAGVRGVQRSNINAVRTCHYPNQSAWYSLCDENGIYVMDGPASRPRLLAEDGCLQALLGRARQPAPVAGVRAGPRRSMFERDKTTPPSCSGPAAANPTRADASWP